MPNVIVRGIRLHYEERGHGRPLLCLPGALGTGTTDFAPQLDELSRSVHVIAPDPRGYGRSRPPDRDFPLDFLARDASDMAALMAELSHHCFSVAGWSDGANTAVLLAIKHPERVRRLVIWGGNAEVTPEDIALLESVRFVSSWSVKMRQTLGAVYGEDLQSLWTAWYDGIMAIYASGGEICRTQLDQVRCPTLILHGAKDPLVPDFHPWIFHHAIAHSRLHIFPEGRHNPHLSLASEFNQVVGDFLAEDPDR